MIDLSDLNGWEGEDVQDVRVDADLPAADLSAGRDDQSLLPPGSLAGVAETIRVTRSSVSIQTTGSQPPWVGDRWEITWTQSWPVRGTESTGLMVGEVSRSHYWTTEPPYLVSVAKVVALGDEPWFRGYVVMTAGIYHPPPNTNRLLACVYIRREDDYSYGAYLGLPAQWEDESKGNHHEELFSERYFSNHGPGVYELDIVRELARAE